MRIFFLFLIIISSLIGARAQSLRYAVATPYVSLGSYSLKQHNVFCFVNNQAALASDSAINAGVYGERRFMLAENSSYLLAAAFPTSKGNFGVQLNYAGFKDFNENKVGLAYARNLGRKVALGIQFNYYRYSIPAYNSASAINFEGGLIMHFSEQLHGGIHIYNPVGGKLSKATDEKLASAYKFGLGYDATENFFVSAEIQKEENKTVNVIGGFQYQLKEQFFARAGFVSETGSGFAGAGVALKNIRIDVSAGYHPQLGFSPGVLVMTNFKQKAK